MHVLQDFVWCILQTQGLKMHSSQTGSQRGGIQILSPQTGTKRIFICFVLPTKGPGRVETHAGVRKLSVKPSLLLFLVAASPWRAISPLHSIPLGCEINITNSASTTTSCPRRFSAEFEAKWEHAKEKKTFGRYANLSDLTSTVVECKLKVNESLITEGVGMMQCESDPMQTLIIISHMLWSGCKVNKGDNKRALPPPRFSPSSAQQHRLPNKLASAVWYICNLFWALQTIQIGFLIYPDWFMQSTGNEVSP